MTNLRITDPLMTIEVKSHQSGTSESSIYNQHG